MFTDADRGGREGGRTRARDSFEGLRSEVQADGKLLRRRGTHQEQHRRHEETGRSRSRHARGHVPLAFHAVAPGARSVTGSILFTVPGVRARIPGGIPGQHTRGHTGLCVCVRVTYASHAPCKFRSDWVIGVLVLGLVPAPRSGTAAACSPRSWALLQRRPLLAQGGSRSDGGFPRIQRRTKGFSLTWRHCLCHILRARVLSAGRRGRGRQPPRLPRLLLSLPAGKLPVAMK